MPDIIIKTANQTEIAPIERAITAELKRLEWSYEQIRLRLESFEQKYHCPSRNLVNLAAEDLEGGDLEYVQWAGEYQFFLDLAAEIKCLKDITYVLSESVYSV
ncbi:MAG: hypothetical protein Fur0025_32010 [Oscillatoriaceae cyanobacterium]